VIPNSSVPGAGMWGSTIESRDIPLTKLSSLGVFTAGWTTQKLFDCGTEDSHISRRRPGSRGPRLIWADYVDYRPPPSLLQYSTLHFPQKNERHTKEEG